jgi:chromosome partitioning protein
VKVAATYNIKGGVGKTSTAVNLAYLSARQGHRTVLWDLDAQGAATYIFRIEPRVKGSRRVVRGDRPLDDAIKGTDYPGLDLIPADFTYRHMDLLLDDAKRPTRQLRRLLRQLSGQYDHVFLDCPPSMSLLSENILHAADVVLVPLIPTTLSVRTMDQLAEFVDTQPGRRPRLLGFFSMADRRRKLHRDIIESLPRQRRIARTVIPTMAIVEQMAARREPVPHFAPRSVAATRYRHLWAETFGKGLRGS